MYITKHSVFDAIFSATTSRVPICSGRGSRSLYISHSAPVPSLRVNSFCFDALCRGRRWHTAGRRQKLSGDCHGLGTQKTTHPGGFLYHVRCDNWRRGGDSNPRLLRVTGFQDQLHKPLGHLSQYDPIYRFIPASVIITHCQTHRQGKTKEGRGALSTTFWLKKEGHCVCVQKNTQMPS